MMYRMADVRSQSGPPSPGVVTVRNLGHVAMRSFANLLHLAWAQVPESGQFMTVDPMVSSGLPKVNARSTSLRELFPLSNLLSIISVRASMARTVCSA